MRALRRRLRGCTWLALLAMLTLAFGPTISRLTLPEDAQLDHALALEAPVDHAAMHHAAAATPMHAAAMDAVATHAHHHHATPLADAQPPVSPPAAPPHHHTLAHCALCALAAGAYAVAPTLTLIALAAPARRSAARIPERGPAPGRTPRSPATSRGPPAFA